MRPGGTEKGEAAPRFRMRTVSTGDGAPAASSIPGGHPQPPSTDWRIWGRGAAWHAATTTRETPPAGLSLLSRPARRRRPEAASWRSAKRHRSEGGPPAPGRARLGKKKSRRHKLRACPGQTCGPWVVGAWSLTTGSSRTPLHTTRARRFERAG